MIVHVGHSHISVFTCTLAVIYIIEHEIMVVRVQKYGSRVMNDIH